MRFSRTSKALGMVAIAALALTGCGAGGGTSTGAGSTGGDPSKVITRRRQRTAAPPDARRHQRSRRRPGRRLIFAGLTSYDPSGKPVNELAESIEAKDGQNYTIKVKKGQKFTNGEASHRQVLRRCLELRRRSKNAQLNSGFFECIEGLRRASQRRRRTARLSTHRPA